MKTNAAVSSNYFRVIGVDRYRLQRPLRLVTSFRRLVSLHRTRHRKATRTLNGRLVYRRKQSLLRG